MDPMSAPMDAAMTCNIPECGVRLTDEALVTACTHVFCLDCARRGGFAEQPPYNCPACQQLLIGDNVTKQTLQPSEE
ncbi:hypothetical protein B0H63DRAFT_520093 [Podospora didyma]|uniref:RING-type domain-containing protein n=1 Tax=Podospora didyma TaxID=330526 RepID=A0AAE0P063_9PEZI|nr:hypothetical protein B0H63DRAFT_520093 [Podospora didyma]